MTKETNVEGQTILNLEPICRFKYLSYLLIDCFIVYFLLHNIDNIGLSTYIFFVNLLIVLPFFIIKRTKDIGFSVKKALIIYYVSVICSTCKTIYPFNPFWGFFHLLFGGMLFVLQLVLLFNKGIYDGSDIFSTFKPALRKLFFLNYIKNEGLKRLCFLIATISAGCCFFLRWNSVRLTLRFWNLEDVKNALIGFYVPFCVFAIIQWIYNGFKSDS